MTRSPRSRGQALRPRRSRNAARLAAVLVAGMALAVVALSCRDIVADEVIDAEAALCDSFAACGIEARACQRIGAFFAENDEAAWDSYLAYYEYWHCADGCGSNEVCLDFPAICAPFGEDCKGDFDCCLASSGVASCSDGGQCCVTLGVRCETASDCCPLTADGSVVECFAYTPDAPRTCGGVALCALPDDYCDDDLRCCGTAVCKGGDCVPETCVERGDPCKGAECCTEGDVCEEGTCKAPDRCKEDPQAVGCCGAAQQGCTIGKPGGDVACCGSLSCRVLVSSSVEGICIDEGQCGPLGITCDSDEDCCENGSDEIHCLGIGFASGVGDARFCQKIGCQLDVDEPCTTALQCCAGLTCTLGTCKKACDPGSCHDVRSFGPPIDLSLEEAGCEPDSQEPDCNDGCTLPEFQAECVVEICAEDDFCCCAEWDPVCIERATVCLLERGGEP